MIRASRGSTMIAVVFGALASLPSVPFAPQPTPVEEMPRLRAALGGGPRLLVKRDDTIGFAFGGNKVRKMRLVAADALAQQADTLITCGGVQSNHARVTAAAAAKLGLRSVLVANGIAPEPPTANALLARLLGAEIRYVPTREARAIEMEAAAEDERKAGRRPYVIPLGASTPLGAAAFAHAATELFEQVPPPDVIVHSSSSGGTQAGLVAGCALAGSAYEDTRHQRRRNGGGARDNSAGASLGPCRSHRPGRRRAHADACGTSDRYRRRVRRRRVRRPHTPNPAPRSSSWHEPKPSSSIRPTPPRRWPGSSHASAPAPSGATSRCSSGIPVGRWGCSHESLKSDV